MRFFGSRVSFPAHLLWRSKGVGYFPLAAAEDQKLRARFSRFGKSAPLKMISLKVGVLVAPAMPSVSVPLDKITGSGSCSCSDDRAFLAADEPAANRSSNASDNSPTPSTMVMPSACLAKAFPDKCSEQ
jgi:hypothetical protein